MFLPGNIHAMTPGDIDRMVTNPVVDLGITTKQIVYVCPEGFTAQPIGFGIRDPSVPLDPMIKVSFGFNEEATNIMPPVELRDIDSRRQLVPGSFLIIRPFGVTLMIKSGQQLGFRIYDPVPGATVNIDLYGYLIK